MTYLEKNQGKFIRRVCLQKPISKLPFVTTLRILRYLSGLLDSIDESEFLSNLNALKEIWDKRERSFLGANQEPSFFKFIYEKVAVS